ncbi:MAG: DUF3592 domain-containing protein [Limisphaerales bacterium]
MHSSSNQIRVGPLGSFLALLVRQGIPFGGFLLLLAFSWVQYLSPWLEMRASQSWPEVECQPLDASSQSGFHYAYEFEGQRFESDRLSLFVARPGNLQELQKKFRRGESVTGYVNPSDPGTAVLSRDDPNDESIARIVLGLFVIAFCSGVTAAWLSGMDKWTAAKAGREKKVLPITRFCECTVYTTLINSFVSIFFIVLLSVPGSFVAKTFMYLALTPFVLLGLLMIYSTIRNFVLIFTEEAQRPG